MTWTRRLARDPEFRVMLRKKHERRLDDEYAKPLASYRAEELERMQVDFFGPDLAYHEARRRFVFEGNRRRSHWSLPMTDRNAAGAFPLGDRTVGRLGYGAMQLAGPGVFGPPKDHGAALAVLREAVAIGVDHIDTSDFYGPHVTNLLIRQALHPYPEELVIVTKVGAVRGEDASWNPAQIPADLTRGVHDNLRNLGSMCSMWSTCAWAACSGPATDRSKSR